MIKISELTPKGANLEATDLLEISEATADGYTSKSITGEEIINAAQSGLQAELVSGTNIKTINGSSLLGSGDLAITASASWGSITGTLSSQTDLQGALDSKQATLVSGTNIKTINGSSLLGSGDLTISGSNIYNADGTLTGARTLTLGGVSLTIAGTTSSRFQANGNVGIGTTTDAGFKLDVNGTARVQSDMIVNGMTVGKGLNNQANNTAVGTNALAAITTGQEHTALGSQAFASLRSSFSGVAIGFNAGNAITTSGFNTIVGGRAMQAGNGANNTIVGNSSGLTNNGSFNTFIGNSVGRNISGSYNIGIGDSSFSNATANTGTSNIAIGRNVMTAVVSGTNNTCIQEGAFANNTSGSWNVGVGFTAGQNNTTGSNNTFVGTKSGLGTNASYNTFIGSYFNTVSGNGITSGSFNTILGSQISGLSASLSNNIILSDGQGNMRLVFDNTGSGFIGATTSYPTFIASSVLTLDSTTKGFLPPRMTTSQKTAIASPTAGLVVFDTTLNKLCVYTTTWETITSA